MDQTAETARPQSGCAGGQQRSHPEMEDRAGGSQRIERQRQRYRQKQRGREKERQRQTESRPGRVSSARGVTGVAAREGQRLSDAGGRMGRTICPLSVCVQPACQPWLCPRWTPSGEPWGVNLFVPALEPPKQVTMCGQVGAPWGCGTVGMASPVSPLLSQVPSEPLPQASGTIQGLRYACRLGPRLSQGVGGGRR